ncbi:ANKLE2 [Lepeophtheirus salmonis]|uniref:ANKLE2 n=1 Tax=Lepeophtheirus salmonis TaxID=72036 RepID=A0A7R8CWK2_LEPSM|nr:ANKLE2 [Lepeophtheirus salmonis]CAF2953840.1 ANKLE2 [Lepeophtheirus salmonis]
MYYHLYKSKIRVCQSKMLWKKLMFWPSLPMDEKMTDEGKMFYGIRYSECPDVTREEEVEEVPKVLCYDASLLKDVLKKYKAFKPRFKIFRSEEEARIFASEEDALEAQSKLPKVPSGNAECPYSSLSPQELASFRKDLESCDMKAISSKISENPRFLVSVSTDTPSIIHSGTRSNALHICAKEFLECLYPKEPEESRKQRGDYLLDNYLNLPQKGRNETPLHIASTYGHLSIIKILVSYSKCIITPCNKFGDTPENVACSRAPDGQARKSLIIEAIKGRVYIPVYRSLEYGGSIGEPWSPATPSKKLFDSKDFSPIRSPYRSAQKKSPLVVLPSVNKDNYSLCDGPKRVSGLLGPISPIEAPKLKKEWKMSGSKRRLNDPNRGFEKQGREIAKKYGIDWREYWEFLDAYVDFSTTDGLIALEDYLEDIAARMESQRNDNVDSFAVGDLSYGFEELEIAGSQNLAEEAKSPMSTLIDEFKELTIYSQSKSVRNPLITNFNRNVKKEKLSFYNEVNNELTHLSEQVLSYFKDYEEDDNDEIYNFVMSESSLKIFSAKVCNILKQELNKEELCDISDKLELFPNTKSPNILKKEFNNSYRVTSDEDEGMVKRRNFYVNREEIMPLITLIQNGLSKKSDSNAKIIDENLSFQEYSSDDKVLNKTNDFLRNLSLSTENKQDSCSEDSFVTAESEWDRASFETASDNKESYIYGSEPSQTDLEVYLALEGVDTFEYPFISAWKDRIEEYDLVARGTWPTKTKNLEESLNISKFDLDLSSDYY